MACLAMESLGTFEVNQTACANAEGEELPGFPRSGWGASWETAYFLPRVEQGSQGGRHAETGRGNLA